MSQFEEIRPYKDNEISQAVDQLINDPMFIQVLSKLYPQPGLKEQLLKKMSLIKTVDQLQEEVTYPLVLQIQNNSTDGLTYSAMEQFHPEESYLFISNHRDIILDSAFLNGLMHAHGFKKTEIAIGDNLLIFPWIKILARLNRSFIVKRNLSLRQQMEASRELSDYIRFALTKKNESVWLAQREGRTKDGNDKTQAALLKMLNMSNKESLVEGFKELNIVPMAISYEIEPCAISKVEELLNKKYDPEFKKTQQDDLKSMANGVMHPKGKVNFGFGNPLSLKIEELVSGKNNNDAIQEIVKYIDQRIYANYKLWPNNFIAYDVLNKSEANKKEYTVEQKQEFIQRMESETAALKFDIDESRDLYLRLYAMPVFNHTQFVPKK